MDLMTLAEGEITRIDYDARHGHRITRIRFRDPATEVRTEIRFTYPDPDWGDDQRGRNPVVIQAPQRGPGVSVVQTT
jgi:hypothetical protein